jgi:hypothetical protein
MKEKYKVFHVKNRFLDYSQKEIKKEDISTVILLDIHIHMDDLNEKTGEDIKKFISKLEVKNRQLRIRPLPPCIFNFTYPEKLKRITKTGVFKFFFSGPYIKSAILPADEKVLEQSILIKKCENCESRLNKCEGIFKFRFHELETNKWNEWKKEIWKPAINIVDIGSGMSEVVSTYQDRIEKCGLYVCLDPCFTDLNELNRMLKPKLKSKSISVLGVGKNYHLKIIFLIY